MSVKTKPLRVGNVVIGGKRPVFILGPCVIESEKFVWRMANKIAEKLIAFGNSQFCFTERGTTFGYNNLVADMRSLCWMREAGYRVIFDATHSVQRPGGAGDSTSGDGVLAPALARAAMATGCDGIFMEVHENPARALSDGPNQIPLKDLPKHLRMLKAIHAAVS